MYPETSKNKLLEDYPKLREDLLQDVQFIKRIGAGSYGIVDEVAIRKAADGVGRDAPTGTICAAKRIHEHIQERAISLEEFVEECQLMKTLRHKNIVQFYGIGFVRGFNMPALVMERMMTNLHEMLDPKIVDEKGEKIEANHDPSRPRYQLDMKYSILYNVADGLAYLHDHSPPIVHRNMSAKNVLLSSGMVAKITDLAKARIISEKKLSELMTQCDGSRSYLPPEATGKSEEAQQPEAASKSKIPYVEARSIDSFSFGVICIFTIGEKNPEEMVPPSKETEEGQLVVVTELERREDYMIHVRKNLGVEAGDKSKSDPIIKMIEQCLDNSAHRRPSMQNIKGILQEKVKANEEVDVLKLMKEKERLQCKVNSLEEEVGRLKEQLRGKNNMGTEHVDQQATESPDQGAQRQDQLRDKPSLKKRENETGHPLTEESNISSSTDLPSEKPKLQRLMSCHMKGVKGKVNVLEKIGDYYRLGVLLLNDDDGSKVRAIEGQFSGRPAPEICREIIIQWLTGVGKEPVTWETLLDVIEEINPSLVSSLQILK